MTVDFLVNSNTGIPTGVDANSFVQRVTDAANTWSAASGLTLQYSGLTTSTCGVDNGIGVNVIGWKTLLGSPPPLGVTTPFTFPGTNKLSEVTTCINNDPSISWSVSPTGPLGSGVYDLQSNALHEFGHWVDLLDLSGANCNLALCSSQVMWSQLPSATFKRILQDGDIEGVQSIYGPTLTGGGTGGGKVVSVDKLAILTPYFGSASLIPIGMGMIIFARHFKSIKRTRTSVKHIISRFIRGEALFG